ncbi:MAG: acyl-CoA dehydrogenase family protein [bacterium]
MYLELDMPHRVVQRVVRQFGSQHISPEVAARMDSTGRFPWEVVRAMGSLGYLGLQVSHELGGAQLDWLGTVIVVEEISRCCGALGLLLAVHNGVVINPLMRFGNQEQKERFLGPLAKGDAIGAFCLTEANAGSEAGAIQTAAVLDADGLLLNGTKVFVTNGGVASLALVFARTFMTGRSNESSVIMVESHREGFSRGPVEELCGMRGNPVCSLSFDGCRVPLQNLLGQPGDGLKIALATLDGGRVGIAAQALGLAQASLDAAISYASERIQFGKPIATFQAIQSKVAQMAVEIEAARLLTYKAARLLDAAERASKNSAMAKLFSSEVAVRAALEAVQIHGGYGYSRAYAVERYLRDAKATQIYEGTSEIQRMVIYRELSLSSSARGSARPEA